MLGKKSDRGPDFGDKMNNPRQYADFRACSNIKPALFRTEMPQISTIPKRRATIPPERRSTKCVNYSKLQQRATEAQKDADFTALNF